MAIAVRTFLFTDLEGSTTRWIEDEAAMAAALSRHDSIIRLAVEQQGGTVVKHTGDGVVAVFPDPLGAAQAAIDAQRGLRADRDGGHLLRSRMALHTGPSEERNGDFFGSTLNRAARILAAAHGGQVLASGATASVVRGAVAMDDLGSHRLRDLLDPEHLHQVLVDDAGAYPPLLSLDAFDHNLPRQRTRLIGREHEVSIVRGLLTESRLVTLTGVGGVGKTRLALEVAARELDGRDGAAFVDLAPLGDPALVPVAVASAFGLPASEGGPDLSAVIRLLRSRSMLVVLDNCEHVLDATAELVETILDEAPETAILATSREPLSVDVERVWRVPSMSEPAAAVELFVERASAVRSDFAMDETAATTVASICRQLDGIPLAIELAAARVSHLSVGEIAERLGERFRLLTGGRRRTRQRHQTLQAALDWSHDLLTQPERVVLRRASVFSGGFTLAALEQVVGDASLDGRSVLDLLASLVDRSLLVRDAAHGLVGRYSALETVRLYALDRLADAGEAEEARHRHAAWVESALASAQPTLDWARLRISAEWLAERDNILTALDWADGAGDLAAVARIAAGATAALTTVVWVDEGWRFFGRADVEAALSGEERARYILASAENANALGDLRLQTEVAERAKDAAVNDVTRRMALLLQANGLSVFDPVRSAEVYDELLSQIPRDDLNELATALARSADPSMMIGDLEEAARRLDRAEEVVGWPDFDHGLPHLLLGRLDRVREVLDAYRSLDVGAVISYRERLLAGLLATVEGRVADAASELVAAARLIERFPIRLVDNDVLTGFAVLAHHQGDHEHAAELLATAAQTPMWARSPGVYAVHVHYRRLVRAHLDAETVRAIRARAHAGATVQEALAAELARWT